MIPFYHSRWKLELIELLGKIIAVNNQYQKKIDRATEPQR
jgi:hypothetical protein